MTLSLEGSNGSGAKFSGENEVQDQQREGATDWKSIKVYSFAIGVWDCFLKLTVYD